MRKEGTFTWESLKRNLQEQVALFSELRSILQNENAYLINHEIENLSAIIPYKDKISDSITLTKEEFDQILSDIIVNDPHKMVKLNDLINLAPIHNKFDLENIYNSLKELSKDINKLNYINKNLIENSMKYISTMMKKIIEINNDEQHIYSFRGYTSPLGGQQNFMSVVA